MVHAFQLLFTDCNYPRAFVWWIGMHAVMFFFLFKEFYTSTYSNLKKKLNKKHKLVLNEQNGNNVNKQHITTTTTTNGYVKQQQHNGDASQYYVNGELPSSNNTQNHKSKVQ